MSLSSGTVATIEICFTGGKGVYRCLTSEFPNAAYKFEATVTNYIAKESFMKPRYGIHEAVVQVKDGHIPGIRTEGTRFKIAVGCSATAEAGTIGDFAHYLSRLAQMVEAQKPAVEYFSPFSMESHHMIWHKFLPNSSEVTLQSPELCSAELSSGGFTLSAKLVIGLFDFERPMMVADSWLPNFNHRWAEIGLHDFNNDLISFKQNIMELVPTKREGSHHVCIKAVDCYIPGIGEERNDFVVVISATEINDDCGLNAFIDFLKKLRQAAVPISNTDNLISVAERYAIYARKDLPAMFKTGPRILSIPNENGILESLLYEGSDSLLPNNTIGKSQLPSLFSDGLPVITKVQKAILLQKYGLTDSEVPIEVLKCMLMNEVHIVNGHRIIHPEFAIRMMCYSNKKFTECCMWLRHHSVPANKKGVAGDSLESQMIERVRLLEPSKICAIYSIFKLEGGDIAGSKCNLCPGYDHSSVFCIRYPFVEKKAELMKKSQRCIACAKLDCTLNEKKHSALPMCSICNSTSHVDFLCNHQFFANKIRVIVEQLAITADVTLTWTDSDFNLVKQFLVEHRSVHQ